MTTPQNGTALSIQHPLHTSATTSNPINKSNKSMDDNPRPSKRARKSCERCRTRKQKCHGFPVCSNCQSAKEQCIQPPSAIEEYQSGPNAALLERISYLENQLAAYTNTPPPQHPYQHGLQHPPPGALQSPLPPNADGGERKKSHIADIVGFLSLGGEPAYVGSSSGFSLASNLGHLVQATVWNKALASTVSEHQPTPLSLTDLKNHSAGPPNDEMGQRILDAYFLRLHVRYPFLDRLDIQQRHADRFTAQVNTKDEQFRTFKLYMIYAIGATLLKMTESYDYTPPEHFFVTALQYISAARESHSIHNIEAMTLLVVYNLRSPSNSGIWYMTGLAVRTCVDLGLHRDAHYAKYPPFEAQLRRRLFWSVYFLERVIAVSLGRPYSIADRDIDAALPLDIDDSVRDDGLISRTLAASSSPTFLSSRPTSNLTMGVQLIKLKKIESLIQGTIYRVDRPLQSLLSKLPTILYRLDDWHKAIPPCPPSEADYLNVHYNKAIRLLLQPFLTILPPEDPHIALCLQASGQICQIFKRLHQRDAYGHSFIALHSVFIAGVTMCYCLFLSPALWSFTVSNDLRACSSALFVMAERAPAVKKYRDALETVINATEDFMSREPKATTSPPGSNGGRDADHEVVQSLLGLSSQQSSETANRNNGYQMNGNIANTMAPTPQYIPQSGPMNGNPGVVRNHIPLVSDPMFEAQRSSLWETGNGYGPQSDWGTPETPSGGPGEASARMGEGLMDAEWLLSLCEGDGFSLQMLNSMMKFDPSVGT